jgi:hypothetical protein
MLFVFLGHKHAQFSCGAAPGIDLRSIDVYDGRLIATALHNEIEDVTRQNHFLR